jgi:hypothetical protein
MSDSLGLLTTRGRAGLTPAGRTAAQPAVPAQSDEDTCGAFGYLRGIRERALSIEFRFADGNSEAFPYSWLGPVKYNPSAGILIKFVGDLVYLVLIEGSNLNALINDTVNLYDRGIQRHRIIWVREMTRPELDKDGEGEPTVERIRVVSHRPDDGPREVDWLRHFERSGT